jgi:hypothetical protein
VCTGLVAAVLVFSHPMTGAASPATTTVGQVSERGLGNLLAALGLKPEKTDKRYDFKFKSKHEGEDWNLSMSAVLSQDGQAIWIMAWLDELPRSAADVPRTALLRLLSQNDKLGKGKFFAYIAGNRRFVLQRVLINRNQSASSMQRALQDLGSSVAQTYPHWSVANWKQGPKSSPSKQTRAAQAPATTVRRTSSAIPTGGIRRK